MLCDKAARDNVVVCVHPSYTGHADLAVSLAMPRKPLDSARGGWTRIVLLCWLRCCMGQAGCMKSVQAMFNIVQPCRLFATYRLDYTFGGYNCTNSKRVCM